MSQIVNRSTLTISHTFVTGNSFMQNLQVGFVPDEVIVRQITYGLCTTDTLISYIQTDLVLFGDGILGHVIANTEAEAGPPVITNTPIGTSITPMSQFIVNKSKVNAGQATFNIVLPANNSYIVNVIADGQLSITLEFIKYK